jgi:hypothetical protein
MRQTHDSSKHSNQNLLLVREDFFALLAASHAVLLLLAQLGRCELGLLLHFLDFVS